MKIDKGSLTDLDGYPIDEMEMIIAAMEIAERDKDLEALRCAARYLLWLNKRTEISSLGMNEYAVDLFNDFWAELLKNDPPPDRISDIFLTKSHKKNL